MMASTAQRKIEIVEVAARDGLQNEPEIFSTAQKIRLIETMVAAGARRLEVASFVRADRVPQMADAEAVIAGLDLPSDVITIGLVMNRKGALRALDTAVHEVGAVCVSTDSFALRNHVGEHGLPIIDHRRSDGIRPLAGLVNIGAEPDLASLLRLGDGTGDLLCRTRQDVGVLA
jgi:hypothetical protein